MCAYSALSGSLKCLQYAHENGCAINQHVCIDAISAGSLECFKYAFANTSEYDFQTLSKIAKQHNQHDIAGYIQTLIALSTDV
jgi:hypothetical protein